MDRARLAWEATEQLEVGDVVDEIERCFVHFLLGDG